MNDRNVPIYITQLCGEATFLKTWTGIGLSSAVKTQVAPRRKIFPSLQGECGSVNTELSSCLDEVQLAWSHDSRPRIEQKAPPILESSQSSIVDTDIIEVSKSSGTSRPKP